MTKTCFKCGENLPLSEFYKHPMMADGRLNECKKCTCIDSELRRVEKMKDPVWLEAEMERHRIKQARARAKGTAVILTGAKKAAVAKKHARKYPEKRTARIALGNAVKRGEIIRKSCEVCGSTDSEAHHDDYSRALDVVWLCPKHHAERHVELRKEKRRIAAPASI